VIAVIAVIGKHGSEPERGELPASGAEK